MTWAEFGDCNSPHQGPYSSDILISYTFTPYDCVTLVSLHDIVILRLRLWCLCMWAGLWLRSETTEESMSMPLAAARIHCCCWRSSSLGQGSRSSSASWLSSQGSQWYSSRRLPWSQSDNIQHDHHNYHSTSLFISDITPPILSCLLLDHANHVSDSPPLIVILSPMNTYPRCLHLVYHIPIVWLLLW